MKETGGKGNDQTPNNIKLRYWCISVCLSEYYNHVECYVRIVNELALKAQPC